MTEAQAVFPFSVSTAVRFGLGARHLLGELLVSEGWRRAVAVVDPAIVELPLIEELLEDLMRHTDRFGVVLGPTQEPTYDALEERRLAVSEIAPEAVVGIGGGTALDMAKGLAALVHNGGPALEYRGWDRMTEPVVPVVAVPTTAGTGSEVTPNASFVDTAEQRKLGINGEALRPRYALLDPELTVSCPTRATVSAAVDSLVHATEAYVAKKSNRLARLLALEGFRTVFRALPEVVERPDDLKQRVAVMYGAHLAGIALMHSGTGPAAAMSYPLGVGYQVPHGVAGGIFLPHVIQTNVSRGVHAYADFYDAITPGEGHTSSSTEERANNLIDAMRQMFSDLDVQGDASTYGISRDDLPGLVRDTMELRGALEQNPVPFTEEDVERTFLAALNLPPNE